MENSETEVWLDFSLECGYLIKDKYEELYKKAEEIGKILCYMIANPGKFN